MTSARILVTKRLKASEEHETSGSGNEVLLHKRIAAAQVLLRYLAEVPGRDALKEGVTNCTHTPYNAHE